MHQKKMMGIYFFVVYNVALFLAQKTKFWEIFNRNKIRKTAASAVNILHEILTNLAKRCFRLLRREINVWRLVICGIKVILEFFFCVWLELVDNSNFLLFFCLFYLNLCRTGYLGCLDWCFTE